MSVRAFFESLLWIVAGGVIVWLICSVEQLPAIVKRAVLALFALYVVFWFVRTVLPLLGVR